MTICSDRLWLNNFNK